MSKYQPERFWPRLVPAGSVMVSIYGPDSEQAYGVIADVSEGGAQVVAGVHFEPGSRVLLRIGFNPDEPFVAPAEVVWSRDESDATHKSSFVHGVRFRISDPEQQTRLRAILESPSFTQPVVPGRAATATGLDSIVSELGTELGALGERIGEES